MGSFAFTLKKLSGNIYYNNDVYSRWVGLPSFQHPLMDMSLRIYRVAVNIRFRRRSEGFYQIFHIKCGNRGLPGIQAESC